MKRWVRADIDLDAVATLQARADLDERTARLLVVRGITDPAEARLFLHPTLADLPDPTTLKGLVPAAERLADAIASGERIALYGDYDVDGVTSTTLLATFLAGEGVQARTYIPKRLTEGYGLNPEAVEQLASEQTKVLVTLDCGITAADEIARANGHGIDCIVVDHHRCPPELPAAFATLNPQQSDCAYPDKGLAAVGVCFNLVVGIRKVLRERGVYTDARPQPNLRRYLDLVALGTIADMVPLSGVNRTLAWFGLEELRAGRRPGMRALIEVSRLRPGRCSSSDVGFRLGPRINAAGRLDDASVGVQLLMAPDMVSARPLAATLDVANQHRQRIEREVYAAAVKMVEAQQTVPAAIVLHNDAWHPGVVGIVASKLVEAYERPTIIIGEGGRGSARTARGLHLYNAIRDVDEHLHKFGGHRAAAGMTVNPGCIDAFRAAFVARVESETLSDENVGLLVYDDELAPADFTWQFAELLSRLQPFGNGNPQPLFKTSGVRVRSTRIVGKDHLKLRLEEGANGGIEAIAFKQAELEPEMHAGRVIELAYHFERNEFSGNEYLELRVRDMRPV